jgi:hypothetical protein
MANESLTAISIGLLLSNLRTRPGLDKGMELDKST